MSKVMLLVTALALPIVARSLEAQGGFRNRPGALREARRAAKQEQIQEQQRDVAPGMQPNRNQQLQQQVRRSLWKVAKQRIGFSDDQMLQLARTSQRFDQQRRMLAREEKAQRVAIRAEILADSGANQSSIAATLEQLHAVQQRRLDLQADEQKEFATFMTPLQRAKFMALQEQVRRRLQDLARARPDSTAANLKPDAP